MIDLNDKQARLQMAERMEQREPTSELDWPSRDRRRLCQRYLNAEATIEEEQQLVDFYATTTEPISEEEEDVRLLLLVTSATGDDFDLSDDKVAEFDHLMSAPTPARRRSLAVVGWISAAAASIAVLFVLLGHHTEDKADEPQTAVAVQEEIKTEPVAVVTELRAPSPVSEQKKIPSRRKAKSSLKSDRQQAEREPVNGEIIGTMMAAANIMGEQVETYHIQPAGDATIVTKTFADGSSSSCIVCSMDGDEGYSVVPL